MFMFDYFEDFFSQFVNFIRDNVFSEYFVCVLIFIFLVNLAFKLIKSFIVVEKDFGKEFADLDEDSDEDLEDDTFDYILKGDDF